MEFFFILIISNFLKNDVILGIFSDIFSSPNDNTTLIVLRS
jgi:hypothetical protein